MIGLSEKAHALLSQMKDDNFLAEMADGYRSQGIEPEDVPQKRTVFSVATIDPDQEIATAIRALIDLKGGSVYRMAERLADWGVIELSKRFDGTPINIGTLVPKSD
jgi:hypothetical protein